MQIELTDLVRNLAEGALCEESGAVEVLHDYLLELGVHPKNGVLDSILNHQKWMTGWLNNFAKYWEYYDTARDVFYSVDEKGREHYYNPIERIL